MDRGEGVPVRRRRGHWALASEVTETILCAGLLAAGSSAAAAGWVVRAYGVANNVNRRGAACPNLRDRLRA